MNDRTRRGAICPPPPVCTSCLKAKEKEIGEKVSKHEETQRRRPPSALVPWKEDGLAFPGIYELVSTADIEMKPKNTQYNMSLAFFRILSSSTTLRP